MCLCCSSQHTGGNKWSDVHKHKLSSCAGLLQGSQVFTADTSRHIDYLNVVKMREASQSQMQYQDNIASAAPAARTQSAHLIVASLTGKVERHGGSRLLLRDAGKSGRPVQGWRHRRSTKCRLACFLTGQLRTGCIPAHCFPELAALLQRQAAAINVTSALR